MQSQHKTSNWRRRLITSAVAASALIALSGCTAQEKRGYLPGFEDGPVTNQTDRITHLWVGSWVAALVIGIITWALMIWCVIVYRRRKGDNTLPVQTRYHVPLELMYTAVPLILIGGLYFFSVRDTAEVRDVSHKADITVEVIGKQWSWDFNYLDNDGPLDIDGGAYVTGQQVDNVSALHQPLTDSAGDIVPGTDATLPTLVLPVNKVVQFNVESRDVIHSFWIPAFLDKMDMVPGRHNVWQVTPTRVGTYAGKCAELCGEHHSGMLFNVKVVTEDEYEAFLEGLQAKGQSGALGLELNRQQSVPAATSASETTPTETATTEKAQS